MEEVTIEDVDRLLREGVDLIVEVNPESSALLQVALFEGRGDSWGINEHTVMHTDKAHLALRDRGVYILAEDIEKYKNSRYRIVKLISTKKHN